MLSAREASAIYPATNGALDAYLVGDVRTDVLKTAFPELVLQLGRVFVRLLEVLARGLGEVDAVYRASAGFYQGECHLKPEATVSPSDQCNAVGQGELFCEERGRTGT